MSTPHARAARFVAGTAALLVSISAALQSSESSQTRVNQDAKLIGEFLERVDTYVAIHKKADQTVPEVPTSAPLEQVAAHRRAVERLIAQASAKARHGDIFNQPIRAYFRRQISRAFSGSDAAQLKAAIMEENPGRIKLRINGQYPDTVPISTMPPQILAALPKLPKELEYHFIGERLILLDVHVGLVVDYMDDAVPR